MSMARLEGTGPCCCRQLPCVRRHPDLHHSMSLTSNHCIRTCIASTQARFLLTSTSEVYGDPLVHPQPETYFGNVNPIGERSCYDEGKRVAETLTFDYQREHGVEVWDLVEIRFQTCVSGGKNQRRAHRRDAAPRLPARAWCGGGFWVRNVMAPSAVFDPERGACQAKPGSRVKGSQMARATNQRDCSRPRRRSRS